LFTEDKPKLCLFKGTPGKSQSSTYGDHIEKLFCAAILFFNPGHCDNEIKKESEVIKTTYASDGTFIPSSPSIELDCSHDCLLFGWNNFLWFLLFLAVLFVFIGVIFVFIIFSLFFLNFRETLLS